MSQTFPVTKVRVTFYLQYLNPTSKDTERALGGISVICDIIVEEEERKKRRSKIKCDL